MPNSSCTKVFLQKKILGSWNMYVKLKNISKQVLHTTMAWKYLRNYAQEFSYFNPTLDFKDI